MRMCLRTMTRQLEPEIDFDYITAADVGDVDPDSDSDPDPDPDDGISFPVGNQSDNEEQINLTAVSKCNHAVTTNEQKQDYCAWNI